MTQGAYLREKKQKTATLGRHSHTQRAGRLQPSSVAICKKHTNKPQLHRFGIVSHSDSKETPRGKEGLKIERKLHRGKEGSNLFLQLFIHLVNSSVLSTASSQPFKAACGFDWLRLLGLICPRLSCCWTAEKILYFQTTIIVTATCPFCAHME